MEQNRTDSLFQSYRDDLIVIIKEIMDTGDFFSSEEYRAKSSNSRFCFRRVFDHIERFLDVVKGVTHGKETEFRIDSKSWNLPVKFFGLNSTGELPEDDRIIVDDAVARSFYYGLLYHLLAWQSPDSAAIEKIDLDRVILDWAPLSFNSYSELKTYDDLSNYVPSRVFSYYHENAIKPMYKKWSFGFFKRIKAEAFFQRLFFAGCLFSVKAVEQITEK